MPGHMSPIPFPSYMVSSRQQMRRGSGAANSETYPCPPLVLFGVSVGGGGIWHHAPAHKQTLFWRPLFSHRTGASRRASGALPPGSLLSANTCQNTNTTNTHTYTNSPLHPPLRPSISLFRMPCARPNQSLVANTPSLSDRCSSSAHSSSLPRTGIHLPLTRRCSPSCRVSIVARPSCLDSGPIVHLAVDCGYGFDPVRGRFPRARDRMISQAPCCATH
jgi:hypothetical protein